ncbi:MAG TPA: antibiotic biosynthesis monooxygenase [Candidatus Thermoplasmatota archaeon]|nr:antibiotic biosynthesis monooxygenase [Candidatus Thermoplasmatota archaeon]
MIHRFARFEVKKEHLPAALTAIKAFVDEVGRKEGGTATYKSFQDTEHPTRFLHYMVFRVASAEDYHKKTAWHKRFLETLGPLCTEPYQVAPATLVAG